MGFGWLWGVSVGSSSITSLAADDDNWGGCERMAAGSLWEISVPFPEFFSEPLNCSKE